MKNTIAKQIFLSAVLLIGMTVISTVAYGQSVKNLTFTKGRISTTLKGTGTQTYVFKVTRGDMECSAKITSKGKAAKGALKNKRGHDFVEEQDKTDFWATLKNGEYRLTVKAPRGTAFTLKLEVYKMEGQS